MLQDEGGLLYLELEDALSVYGTIFDCSVSEAADQLRSPDGLESALARPRTYAHYQGADLALQAAALVHGIAEGQPFIEGNKRTAYLACTAFLGANGYTLDAPQREVADWIADLSAGLSVDELAEHIRAALIQG